MQVPIRLTLLLRPSVSPGVLLAVGYDAVVMGSTPFLFKLVADRYDVGLGVASLVGVLQMLGFVAGSWGAGRFLSPRRRMFVACLAMAMATNLASALLPPFGVLIGLRFLSGITLGLISWFAWVQVFGDERGMGDVAVIGPLVGVTTSPVVAAFAGRGIDAVFLLLAAVAAVPLLWNRSTGATHRVPARTERSRPVPAAAVLLVCLGLFTVGGSSVFQFAVVLGDRNLGLGASTVALALSANAIAAVPATKWPWSRWAPAPWMALTGLCAVTLTVSETAWLFTASVMVWGFAFWMGLPGAFTVLADRSAHPADRAGDAQAVMAAGRVAGPLLGGFLLDGPGSTTLGLVGGGLMLASATGVLLTSRLTPVRNLVPSER